jgi:hypothetical protein
MEAEGPKSFGCPENLRGWGSGAMKAEGHAATFGLMRDSVRQAGEHQKPWGSSACGSEWDGLDIGGCSGGTLGFSFFVENGLAEFLKPSQWLRTTYEAPYQRYE